MVEIIFAKRSIREKLYMLTLLWTTRNLKSPVTLQSIWTPGMEGKNPRAAPTLGLWPFQPLMLPWCCDPATLLKVFLTDPQLAP